MKNDEENVVHRINNIDDVEVADNEMTCDVYYKEYTIHYKAQKFDSLQIQKKQNEVEENEMVILLPG